jgi:serine/threonine-protein kinase haspin
LKTWQEAASVLYQVTSICSKAEKSVQFEVSSSPSMPSRIAADASEQHRDLHWGNILLRRSDPLSNALSNLSLTPRKQTPSTSKDLEASGSGIDVTLIDFTLSRARMEDGRVLFDPFADECFFEGEGKFFPSPPRTTTDGGGD